MKRLWLAVILLGFAVTLCIGSQLYQHRQMDILLAQLDELDKSYAAGDISRTTQIARQLAEEYRQRTALMDCYIAHGDLADSRETAALLPSILEQDNREEFLMETARLREQMEHLRGIEHPTFRNIL